MRTFTLSFLFFCIGIQAQVGIGNTDPKATLDITGQPDVATELDGIMAPRLTGVQLRAKTYTTAQTSALVYVTVADSAPAGQTIDVTAPGYYYFDGTKWTVAATTNDWKTTGNSGTTAGTNFLGTTDDIDLVFKRFGIQAGLLTASTIGNTAFGVNSLLAPVPNLTTSPTQGVWNTAIGDQALKFNAAGHRNTAAGSWAMERNTTGYQNTAMGRSALRFNTTGYNNMAIGQEAAKWNKTGHDNAAIGFNALLRNDNGSYNVAIGRSAMAPTLPTLGADPDGAGDATTTDYPVTYGDNNIAIGYLAQLPDYTASNQMVLGNSSIVTAQINGLITAPTVTNALITAEATGKALVTKEYLGTYAPLASPVFTGNIFFAQPNPTAFTNSATLTAVQLLTKLITVTRSNAVTLTLPTGANTDSGVLSGTLANTTAFEWTIINLGSGTGVVTVAAATNHTIVGLATTQINSQSTWRTVKTATNTFVTYRVH